MPLNVDPVVVFNDLNRFLCARAAVGRCDTMFFGLVDSHGALEFLSASHPAPLLLRRGEVSELYTTGSLPIGLLETASYTSSRIQLNPGDMLLLYTDGITAAADRDSNLFQDERLKEVFAQNRDSSLKTLQDGVWRAVEEFARGENQSDDITLLCSTLPGSCGRMLDGLRSCSWRQEQFRFQGTNGRPLRLDLAFDDRPGAYAGLIDRVELKLGEEWTTTARSTACSL